MESKNSKKITIFRAGSFLSRAQGPEIEDYFSASKKSVGSYWESVDSKRIASGLTFEEQKILLPSFVEVDSNHPEFMKKVGQFYADIDTQVPHVTGRTLEIGLVKDNNAPISADNMPLEPMDYIRYRHVIKHPHVGKTKEEADGNPLKEFYIFDKQELQKKNTRKTEEKDASMKIYLEIKEDDTKVKMMLTLMGIDPRGFSGKNEKDLCIEELRKLSETKPEDFVKVYSSTNLETEYWLRTLLNSGVLKQVGNKVIDSENNKLVGNNMEEAIFYFEDDSNSDLVVTWKARHQDKQYNSKPHK